jgi:hypothetical protein
MNPVFTLLIKQLPRLLPVVKSMLERPAKSHTEDGRLAGLEQSVEWLAERSDTLEKKLRRQRFFVLIGLAVSLLAFAVALSR